MLSNKIPVFLHIPKNSGTYAIGIINKLFKQIRLHTIIEYDIKDIVYRLLVKDDNNHTCFTIFLYNYDKSIFKDPKIVRDTTYTELPTIHVDYFKKWCLNKKRSLSLFCIVIEDHGVKYLRTDYLKDIESIFYAQMVYFTVLRENFYRQQSLYNYICSENSKHEPTHGTILSNSFEEYIVSNECDCCWLVRNLSGNQSNELTDNDFNKACEILDSFMIDKHTNIIEIIDSVFKQCHNITTAKLDDISNVYRHETQYSKLSMTDIDSKSLEKFLLASKYENALYDRYIINS